MNTKNDAGHGVLVRVSPRELSHVLAALRLLQTAGRHSADLDDIATDSGNHAPMAPDDIDDLCERLNLSRNVGEVMRGLPSMVVLSGGETWTALDDVELVFLPADADEDILGMYDNGEDADHIVPDVTFTPPAGVFDLDRLVRELPLDVLEEYRLKAGKEPGGGE
ncbi:MAG: hypothetical protein HY905_04020 [Deltaproteobacteria bacterium]|nr:hypothetical protein [Deltaproteobacteria bacterium]